MDENGLKECTVPLKAGRQRGTGFFVGSNTVLTCAHVVRDVGLGGRVDVGEDDFGKVARLDTHQDVALVNVTRSGQTAPLDSEFNMDDPIFSYGYPESAPGGDPISGKVIQLDGIGLLKFKDTPVEPGMSGAPLLNLRTQKVCGMVKQEFALDGGYAIPGETLRRFCLDQAPPQDLLAGIPGASRRGIEAFLTQYLGTADFPTTFGGRKKTLRSWTAGSQFPDLLGTG